MIAFLIKASLVLTILWGFYKLVLEKEGFFSNNRMYLLTSLFLIFTLPFITLPSLIQDQGIVSTTIEKHVYPETIKVTSENVVSPILSEKSDYEASSQQTDFDQEKIQNTSTPIEQSSSENRGFLFWLTMV